MFAHLKMRTKLFLMFVVLSLIPIGFMSVYTYHNAKNLLHQETLAGHEVSLGMTIESLSAFFQSHDQNAQVLASTRNVQRSLTILAELQGDENSPEWAERYDIIDELAKKTTREYGYLNFFLTDPKGRIVYSTDKSLVGTSIADRDYIQESLMGKANWSSIFHSDKLHQNVITLSHPVTALQGYLAGNNVGTINFVMSQGFVEELIHQATEFQANANVYLIRGDGTLLTNTRKGEFTRDGALKGRIDTEAVRLLGQQVSAGNLGFRTNAVYRDYLGNEVLGNLGVVPVGNRFAGLVVEEETREVFAGVNKLRSALGIFVAALVVIGSILANLVSRSLTDRMGSIVEATDRLAEGDLTQTLETHRNDEIGLVLQSCARMIAGLRKLVKGIQANAVEASGATHEMSATFQELSASIEEVASTTNQFASTVQQVASRTQDITIAAGEAADEAVKGSKELEETVTVMDDISTAVQGLSQEIQNLGVRSAEIGRIVGLITDISDQTNLLALNAAIEAARAGEHGRGFAVVAEEVRKLAEQSAEAAQEITGLIAEIQGDTEAAVDQSHDSAAKVDQGLLAVQKTNAAFASIRQLIDELTLQLEDVAAAVQELSASGEEIASSTEEQAASVAEVAATAENVSVLAENLQQQVTKAFKL
ncbi:MAG: HAMP domain-containing protein [Firmicutes bacterium]|nr:HAMP domain-containing protein [Bacillota bacterium]